MRPYGSHGANIGSVMKPLLVVGLVVMVVLWGRHGGAQTPMVEDVVSRGTLYAHHFFERFSNVCRRGALRAGDLGINVPTVMEDRYPRGLGEFRGKATYGRFRRFEVRTEERVEKP